MKVKLGAAPTPATTPKHGPRGDTAGQRLRYQGHQLPCGLCYLHDHLGQLCLHTNAYTAPKRNALTSIPTPTHAHFQISCPHACRRPLPLPVPDAGSLLHPPFQGQPARKAPSCWPSRCTGISRLIPMIFFILTQEPKRTPVPSSALLLTIHIRQNVIFLFQILAEIFFSSSQLKSKARVNFMRMDLLLRFI